MGKLKMPKDVFRLKTRFRKWPHFSKCLCRMYQFNCLRQHPVVKLSLFPQNKKFNNCKTKLKTTFKIISYSPTIQITAAVPAIFPLIFSFKAYFFLYLKFLSYS